MKRIVLITAVLLTQLNFAQVTKNLGDFDQVKVFDKLRVKLIPSNENKIEIKGDGEENVETVNKNGELKIRMSVDKMMKGEDISVQLYFKRIESIDACEGSYVFGDATFKQTNIDLNAKEGAEINLFLDVDRANVRAVSGGILDLTGKASNQDCTITSGGMLKAAELHTAQTKISVSAGGNAEINATTLVDAKVKAGGTIAIYGKPKQINEETLLGGTITEKE